MKLSAAELIRRIRDSRIVSEDRLNRWLETTRPDLSAPDARQLALFIVQSRLISRFQMARLIKGKPVVFGNIVLEELIGAGGMGTVYRARHSRMNRQVAIKILDPPTSRAKNQNKRFQREVQAAAKLTHPNIVTAYDADEQDDCFYLVMEYVDGQDLASLVAEQGPFNVAKAIGCIVQAGKGLHYAHSQGVVHRDIKPSNLLLDKSGILKILDMGLARVDNRNREEERLHDSSSDEMGLTGEHQIIGTIDYMSPEQANDSQRIDERADIYSLGCTLFFLLTGVSPYYRSTIINTLLAHQTEPVPRLADHRDDIPDGLTEVLQKMMAKDASDRFGSMSELIRELNPYDDDTDFHLAESVSFSIMVDDDSETRTLDIDELNERSPKSEPVTLSPVRESANTRKEPAVGIDLGTTYSVIAVLDATGRPQTLSNADGEMMTPSVVLVNQDEVVVGKEAVKAIPMESEAIADCAKRYLGERSYPKRLADRAVPPEVLLSWILKNVREDAVAKVGPFRHAVITVPAYFDEVRRQATYLAGRLAGIEVLDVLNEPTAAALAFADERETQLQKQSPLDQKQRDESTRCLVYDLGGGTFDVTVMEIAGAAYRTLATDGDMHLGGRDWDERLVNFVAEKFISDSGCDPRQSPNAIGQLQRICEEVKRTLTTRRRTKLVYEHQGHTLSLEVTRELYEELTQDLLARTEFTTRETLKQSKLTWDQIDHLLLVGGATRMPAVARLLNRLSGKAPDRSLSPDESVAKGAALRAGAILATRRGEQTRFQITNVNSHSLGVVGRSPKTGGRQVATLIPRNTPLPAEASRTFKTQKIGQRSILVQIVEGESKQADECAQVGRCMVHGLPDDLPAQTPVKVTFSYDENGRLDVELQVLQTQQRQIIHRPNSLSEEEFAHWQHWIETGELQVDEAHLLDLE